MTYSLTKGTQRYGMITVIAAGPVSGSGNAMLSVATDNANAKVLLHL